jgi:hypothetical protein
MDWKLIGKATAMATKIGGDVAIIEIDKAEGREITIVPVSYLNSQEYEVFEGCVLEIISAK